MSNRDKTQCVSPFFFALQHCGKWYTIQLGLLLQDMHNDALIALKKISSKFYKVKKNTNNNFLQYTVVLHFLDCEYSALISNLWCRLTRLPLCVSFMEKRARARHFPYWCPQCRLKMLTSENSLV